MSTSGAEVTKQIVIAGVAAFALCATIGWWNKASNLKKKPRQQGSGIPVGMMSPPMQQQAPGWERKLEEFLYKADGLHKQRKYAEAEKAYLF